MDTASEHDWFTQQIGAYLAGGLDSAEVARFDAHAAGCAACAGVLAEARSADDSMRELFKPLAPAADFEDCILQRLRSSGIRPRWYLPKLAVRVAVGAVAASLLAGFGFCGTKLMEHGGLQRALTGDFSANSRVRGTSNLRQIGEAVELYGPSNDHTADTFGGGFLNAALQSTVATNASIANESPRVQRALNILKLHQLAREQIDQHDYKAAQGVLDQIKTIDPKDDYATGVEQFVQDKAALHAADDTLRYRSDSASNQQANDHGKDGQNELNGFQGAASFNNNPFVGTNKDNIYGRGAGAGSSPVDSPQVANDGILLPTDDDPSATTNTVVTRVYNVRDLLKDQPASDPATNVGGGSFSSQGAGAGQTGQSQQINDIERKIENNIAFSTWKANDPNGNGAIDDLNDQLVITQTPQVQAQIAGLLATVRRSSASGTPAAPSYFTPKSLAMGVTDNGADGSYGGTGTNFSSGLTVAAGGAATPTNPQTPLPGQVRDTGAANYGPAPATQPSAASPGGGAAAPAASGDRKIIRNGEMAFEVDSFDSAALQISKIVAEGGGFVATTDSDKLANGKMAGIITVRVPPDHLDTFVLKIRALGDLKSQKIGASDVTREYTDLTSELRAATVMEQRLLDIVKTGKGEVKDLVEAEKELGVWREKVEKVTGEINYYNNLVALATLEINLTERDIRQAALATEMETVNMGVETADVQKARAAALKIIDDSKGRVIQSDLKQLEAGELAAQITADIAPDSAGPAIDRLQQLGRVARLEIGRNQSTADGAPAPAGVRVDRQDTRFSISLYNLANVAPRETDNLTLACADVEKTYHDAIAAILKGSGRVINSSLNRPRSDQIDGAINFEMPAEQADAVLADIRGMGEVMHLTVTENPDAANVSTSKRGFVMTLASLATVQPREVITRTLMPAGSVAGAYQQILAAAQAAGARVVTAQLQESGGQAATGQLAFDVLREKQPQIETAVSSALGADGKVVARQSVKSADTEHTVDSKVGMVFTLSSSEALSPRLTTARVLAVTDVPGAYNAILAAAQTAGAKIASANLDESERQNISGILDLVVPRENLQSVENAVAATKGGIVSRDVRLSPDQASTTDSRVGLLLTIKDLDQIPPRQTTTLRLQADDPEKDLGDLQAAAMAAGGRVVTQQLSQDGQLSAHVVVDIPLAAAGQFIDHARSLGTVNGIDQAKDPNIPDADFTRGRVDVTLVSPTRLVDADTGLWPTLKSGLGTSIKGLLYSLELIIIGLCLILPWALLLWAGYKAFRHTQSRRIAAADNAPSGAEGR